MAAGQEFIAGSIVALRLVAMKACRNYAEPDGWLDDRQILKLSVGARNFIDNYGGLATRIH
ncbi:MAG: hypothetical protein OXC45_08515 [Gemmatimonadetes bacterium]|nr:hypothetical protein [Gemmatimonadota bacterium]